MRHEEFADRARRRIEAVAVRLESEDESPPVDGEPSETVVRAQELRVAALLVRDEAAAVDRAERSVEDPVENPPLEAQG